MVKTDEALTRGVADILPSKKGLADLMAKKKITLYQGFDPSMSKLHIGNWIGIRKLAQFQQLGHKVIFLVGDFTGTIGDPTDKSAARKKLTRQQVLENAKDYKKQIAKTLKFTGPNAAEIRFNSEWLNKLNFEEVIELSSHFTVQQLLERDFFQQRLKKEKPIYLHEFLYPLMQGYDCVMMDVDLEIGGNDQLFNMMAGRMLMKALKGKEKYVLTMKILEDPTGKKMGKTEGNTINLTDLPINIFGKIMALPDSLINPGVELLTDLSLDLTDKLKPLESKKALAFDVVKQLHGEVKAKEAQKEFEKTFQKRAPEYKTEIAAKPTLLATVAEVIGSVSQAKRLIKQGAVDINGATVSDPTHQIKGGEKIKIGKKTFVKVKK
ncbi:tyrosine--tRNA ligase [Candidatus Woesebacteria bacterium]|nr:tyrosine--tRNA ligase [Candidatus Woesebacteria bacterium]